MTGAESGRRCFSTNLILSFLSEHVLGLQRTYSMLPTKAEIGGPSFETLAPQDEVFAGGSN